MSNEKNQNLTTITVKVTTTLKQVIKIISKDLKVTPNQFIETILAKAVGDIVDQARENIQKQQSKVETETSEKVVNKLPEWGNVWKASLRNLKNYFL